MRKLVFTVTNDLSYDQRMIRICTSLALNGYEVTLVGRLMPHSRILRELPFKQKRLKCFFHTGKLFYLEFNIRLFLFLLTRKANIICAIDLDTILPCYFVALLKRIPKVYDAHELFCEMQEIVTRPAIYGMWKWVERFAVPKFRLGYTVNDPIAAEFKKMYRVDYEVIRSITVLREIIIPVKPLRYILYQGSVNEGRSFETLIPAMKGIIAPLWICGEGNFLEQAKQLAKENGLEEKVLFKGKISPERLVDYTLNAWIGVTVFEKTGLSNYLSLANRFFDYMHAGVPQVCVDYPAYQQINNNYEIAVLIADTSVESITAACNRLLADDQLYSRLQANCLKARQEYNWQREERKLVDFYNKIG